MSKRFILPTRMNKEGRVQIPKLVRDEMGWTARDQFAISMQDDAVLIERVAEDQHGEEEEESDTEE